MAEPRNAARGVTVTRNPADRTDIVAERELDDGNGLVGAARTARGAQPGWAAWPAPLRGRVMQNVGRLVATNKEALAALITRETGKPFGEALGEVQEVIDTCDFFLGEGRRLYGQTVPSEMPDKQLFTYRKPLGTAVVITAANFPAAVPAWYLVPALLCGNTVVWKPSESAVAVAEALFELFRVGGVPEGVLSLVHADGAATYEGLERALGAGFVQKIGFTGSTRAGRRVSELAGRYLQSPCLELGGKNPLVVEADADLELAVQGAVFSGFATAGQRCTSLGVVIAHRDVHDEFLARFTEAVEDLVIGDPRHDGVFYGPLIGQRYLDDFLASLELVRPHHTLSGSNATGRITTGNPRKGFVGDPDAGVYAHPVIVAGVRPDDELYRTETFGPISSVMPYDTFDEAVGLANGHGYGLSAAIYTASARTAFSFRERCTAGMISVNNSTVGAEAHLPFGGNGLSGNGSRQSGIWVIDQFTSWQSMNWDYAGTLQRAQLDVREIDADFGFRLS